MQGANDNVKCHPRDEEPARPVVTFKHERAGNDGEYAREMNVPVTLQLDIAKRQHPAEKRDAAECNE